MAKTIRIGTDAVPAPITPRRAQPCPPSGVPGAAFACRPSRNATPSYALLMRSSLKAAFAALVTGALLVVGARAALPTVRDHWAAEPSVGRAGRWTIGVDDGAGAVPLCSERLRQRLLGLGYGLSCINDGGEVAGRLQRLASGTLDFAVMTVDAYLRAGAAIGYSGAIVAVIGESRGGHALVAQRATVPDLDTLRLSPEARIAFVPGSAGAHLLTSIAFDFGLPTLHSGREAWRVSVPDSATALMRLRSGEADVAVLREPEISQALTDPRYIELLGTEDTEGLLVEVLIASPRLISERPEEIQALLREYFDVLRGYREAPDELQAAVVAATGASAEQAARMLRGHSWVSFEDNGAGWLGVTPSGLPGREALADSIRDSMDMLTTEGLMPRNDALQDEPYRLLRREYLTALYMPYTARRAASSSGSLQRPFAPLDSGGWAILREVGVLRVRLATFAPGTAALDAQGRAVADLVARQLRRYPNYRLLIRGYGDASADQRLTLQRAAAVADYLTRTYGIDPNRVRTVALDPQDSAWPARVEFTLMAGA